MSATRHSSGKQSPGLFADPPHCPNCWTRSRPIRRSQLSPPMAPSTPASATRPSPPEALRQSSRLARTPSLGSLAPLERSHETKPSAHHGASGGPSGDDGAAITARAAQRPRCDLCQTTWPAADRPGLRPSGRRVPGPCRRAERLHRARHTHHGSRGMSLSGERETPAIRRFVQQSRRSAYRSKPHATFLNGSRSDILTW